MEPITQTHMPLLTPELREKLLANGRQSGRDHVDEVAKLSPETIKSSEPAR